MGSNMQRQAVPLLGAEPPIVATGLENDAARDSGMVVVAGAPGRSTRRRQRIIVAGAERSTARRPEIGADVYELRKFGGSTSAPA